MPIEIKLVNNKPCVKGQLHVHCYNISRLRAGNCWEFLDASLNVCWLIKNDGTTNRQKHVFCRLFY